MGKRAHAFIILAVMVLSFVFYFRAVHTFRLSDEPTADSYLKSQQIQPILGTIEVWSTVDTDVWFTDVEDPGKRFQIGYITPGMKETIKLEKGKWYIVHGAGDITVRMVNVRVE